uniref:Ig-like domain-containing protein n=1 Tax=Oryzias melastigma TaxID=30732 RepID=A0A3B3C2P5_ORYME
FTTVLCLTQEGFKTAQAPKFDVPLKPLEVTLGEKLNLHCHVSGSPPLTIQWMKDRKELKSGENTIITFVDGTASLELRPMSEVDAGDYLCKATNASGSDFCKSKDFRYEWEIRYWSIVG